MRSAPADRAGTGARRFFLRVLPATPAVALAGVAVALAALAVIVAGTPAAAQTVVDPDLVVDALAFGLSVPTSMAFIGPDDILVLQKQDGQVRRIVGGVLQPAAVLDVAVDNASERGLLGIAVDPEFGVNRRVFLYYTESSTGADTSGQFVPLGNRIYAYTWDGSALVNPVLVLDLPVTNGPNHDGGVITFGPDGALYAVIGDLNRTGQMQNFPLGAPADGSGGIFRIDVAGMPLNDNPFFTPANPANPMNRYYAYGVRNSFGLAFDPFTGDLWDTENGPNDYDEVNRVVPGFNSGWTQIMGPDARDPQGIADLFMVPGAVYRDPEFSWLTTVAPTALVFPASPVMGCSLRNDLLVADNNCGLLYRFRLDAARDALTFASPVLQDKVADNATRCSDEMDEILFGSGFGAVTDLEIGPDGRLYMVSISQGVVYRIGPPFTGPADQDSDGVADLCDCAPSDAGSFGPPIEVARLGVSDSANLIAWTAQGGLSGQGTTYTVVTGDLAALRTNGGYASACTLRQGLAASQTADPRPVPPVGAGYFYLARAENACASGTFGDAGILPDPRDALDAALPPACP